MLGTWGFQSAEEDENIKNLREIIKAIQWSNDNMQAHILLDKTKWNRIVGMVYVYIHLDFVLLVIFLLMKMH